MYIDSVITRADNTDGINFLAEKTGWINTQYVYATNAGNIELLKNSKTDIDAVLSKALALLDDSIAKESNKENIQKMVNEMEKRYQMFSQTGTKKIEGYNEYVEIAKLYSTPKSGSFINGTLDGIVKTLKEENKLTKN